MNMLDKALIIADCFHRGQVDKGGTLYINHPIWVSKHCRGKNAKIVALLHDVIEDTRCTVNMLKSYGFSKKVIDAVVAITHVKGMQYSDYIQLVKLNKIARQVKFWDMVHNSDITRIPNPQEIDIQKSKDYIKYAKELAYDYKTQCVSDNLCI